MRVEEKINKTIDYYKEKYEDATHNCVAYLVGTKKEPMMMENYISTCRSSNVQCFKKQELVILLQLLQDTLEALNTGGLTRAYK